MKKFILTICLSFVFLLAVKTSFARDDGQVPIVESQHFHISTFKGCDIAQVLHRLNYDYSTSFDSFYERRNNAPKEILAKTLDTIFADASDVLDINLFSYKGSIKIFPNKQSMRGPLSRIMAGKIEEPSYYIRDSNTIYISYEDMTLGMLGHEIAHAIISNYFVVAPPPKVHEVLAGYVEYSLRKSSGTLRVE